MHNGERVLVCDPGHRTGWAECVMDENRIAGLAHGVLGTQEMEEKVLNSGFDVLVCEGWKPRPIDGSMNWIQGNPLIEVQHLGVLRYLARQARAKQKTYGPDRKRGFQKFIDTVPGLAAIGEHQRACHEQHDQDALMHLVGYFMENWVSDPNKVVVA